MASHKMQRHTEDIRRELTDILNEQGKAELTCQFCDRVHAFSGEELSVLIEEAKKAGK